MKKYIVIGLGNLGRALAENLTSVGYEIIGVDINMHHIDLIKTKIAGAICLDSSDMDALRTLPFKDMDGVFVCYSKDFGLSVQTVAFLRSVGVENIIARGISQIHETVLRSIGIKKIMRPELDFANNFTSEVLLKNLFDDCIPISDTHYIFKIEVPPSFEGKTLEQIKFSTRFPAKLVAVEKAKEVKNLLGILQIQYTMIPSLEPTIRLEAKDRLILFGKVEHLKSLELLSPSVF